MKRVLIVDDDPAILELLRLYFEKEAYEVMTCLNGEDALASFERVQADVVLLDLMLPGQSGFDVLRVIRKTSSVPVLILTARGDTLDKVVGLELGADDYIEKPFDTKELVARVKAVLRRVDGDLAQPGPGKEAPLRMVTRSGLAIDRESYSVRLDAQLLAMPPKEFELLFFLAANPNRVYSRDELLEHIWGFDYDGEPRTVDVHIKRLREKLDRVPHPSWRIATVWSVGYKFEWNEQGPLA